MLPQSTGIFSRSQLKDKRVGKPFVTISYQVGAYGISVVEDLCKYLQKYENRKKITWKVLDKDLALKVMEDYKLSPNVLPYLSESTASEIEDIIEATLGVHPSRFTLIYEMNKTILKLAKSGNAIIVGRGANMVTAKVAGGVHVRLIGSLEKRANFLKKYLKLEEKEARKFIPEEDQRRSKYFKKYFFGNIEEPSLYDLVINTDRIAMPDIVKTIGGLIIKSGNF